VNLEEGTFNAILITTGRRSGKEHAVELKAVYYHDKFYFSRRNPNSDWLKNSIAHPQVKIKLSEEILVGTAELVKNEELARKISQLKYSDGRAQEARVVLQVTLNE